MCNGAVFGFQSEKHTRVVIWPSSEDTAHQHTTLESLGLLPALAPDFCFLQGKLWEAATRAQVTRCLRERT